jgi:DnaJ-class molecular chaperone
MGGFEDILRQMGGGMEGRPQGGGARGGMGGFEDILRQMGGGMGGRPRGAQRPAAPPAKGQDIEQEITIPFAIAVLGGTHQVRFTRPSGKSETIEVKIPAGIEPSQKIRLRGQGYPSPEGGPPGDLKVLVKIAPHPKYARSGLNLTVTVPITVTEAAAGAKIDLPTPHGTVSLSVPAGSSSGKPLRLRGMGIRAKDRSGDLIATLQIEVPKKVSESDLELLKQLSPDWNAKMRTDLKW